MGSFGSLCRLQDMIVQASSYIDCKGMKLEHVGTKLTVLIAMIGFPSFKMPQVDQSFCGETTRTSV